MLIVEITQIAGIIYIPVLLILENYIQGMS